MLISSSCLDEIEFDVPTEFQNGTAVLGKIIKGNPSIVDIRLQRLFDFSFSTVEWVNASIVQLVDQEGKRIDIPFQQTGRYFLEIFDHMDFEVDYGKEYALELCLFDGQCYMSSFESLKAVPEMEKVNEKIIQKEVVGRTGDVTLKNNLLVSINTPLETLWNEEQSNLRYEYLFTFKMTDVIAQECYINGQFSDQLIIHEGEELTNSRLDSFTVLDLDINQILTEGYYIEIIQEALSSGALNFYQQINQLSTRTGTFYDPPPGLLPTNFVKTNDTPGRVFGYFYATEHDTITTFIDSTVTKFYTTNCPKPRPDCPDECCDCLELENSTLEKPIFWPN